MSRNNIWAHLAIALVLVLVAAFAGQIAKWRRHWTPVKQSSSSQETSAGSDESEEINSDDQRDDRKAEVLVRFRAGITQDAIEKIAQKLNDEIEDRNQTRPRRQWPQARACRRRIILSAVGTLQ